MDPYDPIPVDPDALGPDGEPLNPQHPVPAPGSEPDPTTADNTGNVIDAAYVGLLGADAAGRSGLDDVVGDVVVNAGDLGQDLIGGAGDAISGPADGLGGAVDAAGSALDGCGSCSLAVLVALLSAGAAVAAVLR
jgi:hypothetical protein